MIFFGAVLPLGIGMYAVWSADDRSPDADTPAGRVLLEEAKDPTLRKAVDEELSAARKSWKSEREEALSVFSRRTDDEITGASTYTPKKAPKYTNTRTAVYGYYLTDGPGAEPKPGIMLNYAGSDWVFWDSAILKSGDFKTEISGARPDRDHAGGKVGEVLSLGVVDGENRYGLPVITTATLRALTTGGEVLVRFSGKRSADHTLSRWEVESLSAALVLATPRPTREDAAAVVAAQRSSAPKDVDQPSAPGHP